MNHNYFINDVSVGLIMLGDNDSHDESICIFIFIVLFLKKTVLNLLIFCSLLSDSA